MEPTTKMTVNNQPQAAMQMSVSNPAPAHNHQGQHAKRLRGGGAAKDCFIGALSCFLCFECCKDCCDCFGDIICCPCEMCCGDSS